MSDVPLPDPGPRLSWMRPSPALAHVVWGYACRQPGQGRPRSAAPQAIDFPANVVSSLVMIHGGSLHAAGDPAPVPRFAISGARTVPSTLLFGADLDSTTVVFRPGLGLPLLGLPADAFVDRFVDASDALSGSPWDRLFDETAATSNARWRVALLEEVLLSQLADLSRHTSRIAVGIRDGFSRLSSMTVDALAWEFGVTSRTLQRRTIEWFGVSPKPLLRIARMNVVVNTLSRAARGPNADLLAGSIDSLAGLAIDCGFADQSHLGRELRSMTGRSPLELRAELLVGADRLQRRIWRDLLEL